MFFFIIILNSYFLSFRIIFYEMKNYDIKHRIMKTENDNKLISLNKETYHIPMYNPENWEKDLTSEKYVHHKVLNRSFLMTKEVLNHLKNKTLNAKTAKANQQQSLNNFNNQNSPNKSNFNKSNNTDFMNSNIPQIPNKINFMSNMTNSARTNPNQINKFMQNNFNQYVYSTNLLRKPEEEMSKEILIEKQKKELEKKHPMKNIAELIRKRIQEE